MFIIFKDSNIYVEHGNTAMYNNKTLANIDTRNSANSCEYCGKSFTQKINLTQHMFIHTGNKRYSCGIRGKTFRHKSHITNHIFIHTGSKPHTCGICGNSFTQKNT